MMTSKARYELMLRFALFLAVLVAFAAYLIIYAPLAN